MPLPQILYKLNSFNQLIWKSQSPMGRTLVKSLGLTVLRRKQSIAGGEEWENTAADTTWMVVGHV